MQSLGKKVRLSILFYRPTLFDYLRSTLFFSSCFPSQLVKTADLDPRHNYILGFHPHGVLVAGAFTNFCTYATGFREMFPGLTSYLLMLPLWFRAPFFRDYIMCAGKGQTLNPDQTCSSTILLKFIMYTTLLMSILLIIIMMMILLQT